MSLIKLAVSQTIVVSHNNSKSLNKKNLAAATIGGTLGFAAKEGIEHLPGFSKSILSHRYASRMGSVIGGLIGAGTTYSYFDHKNKTKTPGMVFM